MGTVGVSEKETVLRMKRRRYRIREKTRIRWDRGAGMADLWVARKRDNGRQTFW